MTKNLFSALVAFFIATEAYSEIIGAVLVADDSKCRHGRLVFSNNSGFVHAEWFGGIFWEDRVYFGDFHTFGMTDIFDEDGDVAGRIWVDDYWMSNEDASEFCYGEDSVAQIG